MLAMKSIILLILSLLTAAPALAAAPTSKPAATQSAIDPRASAIALDLKQVESFLAGSEPQRAIDKLIELRPRLIQLNPRQNRSTFRHVAFAWRLAQLARNSDPLQQRLVLRLAKSHPQLIQTTIFAMSPADDNPERVFAILADLARQFPGEIDRYPNLAAAIALVHDHVDARQGSPRTPEPAELFAFFTRNDQRLILSPRALPPELLVFVVDIDAPTGEMEWALNRYRNQRNIGVRFFDVPYDYAFFYQGEEKEIIRHGYTLPNLIRFGGVCSDQAYFATSVSKSQGAPSAVVAGAGAAVSHAWVGFLEQRGKEMQWNLDSGRYDQYRGVRGHTTDPQTHRKLFEGELRLLAELANTSDDDRLDAIAIADIAAFEDTADIDTDYSARSSGLPGRQPGDGPATTIKFSDADEQLLRAAVDLSPACMSAWRQVRRLAANFSPAQRDAWAAAVDRLCGRNYPDFAVTMIQPLIDGLPDPESRAAAWQAAGRRYGHNVDVAADIALAQAKLWQKAGRDDLALQRCEDVIRKCSKSGPRVVEAAQLAESILVAQSREDLVVRLYAAAFESLIPPDAMASMFARQSAWHQVGTRYGYWLEQTGDDAAAAKLARRLQSAAGPTAGPR